MGFQLTLGLKLSAKNTLENFIGEQNQELVTCLVDSLDKRKQALIYIQGQSKSGKSHLLQACCHRLVFQGLQAAYLDVDQMDSLNILAGLDQLRLVCFDNWNHEKLDLEQKKILKDFVDRSQAQKHIILFSSTEPFDQQYFKDFGHIQTFELSSPELQEMPKGLNNKLAERGLHLPESLKKVILKKAGNCVASLQDILDILEKSQDSEKLKFNTSLLKKLLATA